MVMINTVLDQIQRMDADELDRVVLAVKSQRTYLSRTTARKLNIGDTVSFTESRGGSTVTGTVTKVNRKTVIVNEGYTNWRVPASMLTVSQPA